MSYNKKTWAPRDKISSASLNNIENGVSNATTVFVPFTVSDDGGTTVVTTTAIYTEVKAAVAAKNNVIAEITVVDADVVILAGLAYKTPVSDPAALTFATIIDFGSTAEPEPELLEIIFSANDVEARSVGLATAT